MNEHLLVAWGLIAVALFAENGTLGPVSLPLMLAAVVVVALVVRRGDAWRPRFSTEKLVLALLAMELGLVWVKPPGAFLERSALPIQLLESATVALAMVQLRRRSSSSLVWSLALFVVAGVWLVHASPSPRIDVFFIEQEGARDLLRRVSPYASTFTNPYSVEDSIKFFGEPLGRLTHYPYPPASLLVTALFWRAFGDVRLALVVAELITAAGLFVLARRHGARPELAHALAALYLVHPRGLFVVEQAWTEPLLAAAFVTMLLVLEREPRPFAVAALAIAAFLALKQYSVLLLPPLAATRFFRRTRAPLAVGAALAALVTLPFYLWDRQAFVDDVILFQLHQPFRWAALSLAPPIAWLTGYKLTALPPIAWLASLAYAFRKVPRDAFGFCLLSTVTLLAFFFTAKQAFCNYYYFVMTVLLCAAIVAPRRSVAPA